MLARLAHRQNPSRTDFTSTPVQACAGLDYPTVSDRRCALAKRGLAWPCLPSSSGGHPVRALPRRTLP
eukprot:2737960-Alexandrium_andersonii.AAC.1